MERIIQLKKLLETLTKEREDLLTDQADTPLLAQLLSGDDPAADLESLNAKITKYKLLIRKKVEELGVDELSDFQSLLNSKFLQLRMNARALKMRIRQRLRDRKFELDRLERSYRTAVNGT